MSKDDTLKSLGKILDTDMPRDAVHIAVVPVIAGERLTVGEGVVIDRHGCARPGETPIGLVDPFLYPKVFIQPGQRFWLYLNPGSITSLLHHWEHPSFPAAVQPVSQVEAPSIRAAEASKEWLNRFIENAGGDLPPLAELLDQITEQGRNLGDDWFTVYGYDANGEIPNEFWDHVEVVTGRRFTSRPTYFSCSC